MVRMEPLTRAFYGQQEDEVIFYEIRPHWTRKCIAVLSGVFVALVIVKLSDFFAGKIRIEEEYVATFGILTGLIGFLVTSGWLWYKASIARAFITDRRFVRLEASFPVFVNRRSLFWNEVLKVKGYAPNLFFRIAKIGTLVIQPLMSDSGREDVQVQFVYYFGDLANYIDKILYTLKTKPEEVKEIRPFVPKPAGQRF